MKRITLALCILLLCCSFGNFGMPKRDRIVYQIMGKFSKKMASKGFHGIGTGLAQKEGKLRLLDISFIVDQILTIESGRKLGVECINDFLNCINNRKDFKDYITEYPFTNNNVHISIIGQDPIGIEPGFIRSVHAGEGYIRYYSDSMEPPLYGRILKETFEEAVCILNEQKANTLSEPQANGTTR